MQVGTLIQYRLHVHGLPLRWLTSIQAWEPGRRFVDVQVRGPYALWHHTHTFTDNGAGGTVMTDVVRYSLPFGPLGALAHRALVSADLRRIFEHRARAIPRQLAEAASRPSNSRLTPGRSPGDCAL